MAITYPKYGVTEQKKAELDALAIQVQNAQYEVSQLQSVVNSLTLKSADFTAFLAAAEADKSTALTNFDLMDAVVANVQDLVSRANTVKIQTSEGNEKLKKTASNLSELVNELIFSVEMIDKLTQLVDKKKALNPLISNDLIQVLTTASADANTAIAATLTALQSVYTAMSTSQGVVELTELEWLQTHALYKLMTGELLPKLPTQKTTIAQKHVSRIESLLSSVTQAETALAAALTHSSDSQKAEQAAKLAVEKASADLTVALNPPAAKPATEGDSSEAEPATVPDVDAAKSQLISARKQLLQAQSQHKASQSDIQSAKKYLETVIALLEKSVAKLSNTAFDQQDYPLQVLLTQAYTQSVDKYSTALDANNRVTAELDEAKGNLEDVQVKLASLQSGLAAANAAALAA